MNIVKKHEIKNSIRAWILTNTELFLILVYWELIFYCELHGNFTGFSIWNVLFMLPVATIHNFLLGWFNSYNAYKLNEIFKIILLFILSIFYIGDLIYYQTFGQLLSLSIMGNGTNAITNFWWSIVSTIGENILPILFIELPILLEIVLIFFRKNVKNTYTIINHFVSLVLGILMWLLIVVALPISGTQDYTAYGAYHSSFINTDTASERLGVLPNFIVEIKRTIFGSTSTSSYQSTQSVSMEDSEDTIEQALYNEFEGLDFAQLNEKTDDETLSALCEYLDTVSPTNKNEYTGMFEGYNLIYICAESFSSMAIDKDVTPTLYKMAHNSIVLNNYYNAFKSVTTNGEYALLTGLWPNVTRENTNMGALTGTMGQSIDKNMSMALGNMFNNAEGITSRGYHDYYGYYYGRNESLPNMGFTCKFMGDGMEFSTSWPASDLEMIEQSIDDYINDEQFCTYYMTFSGHGNYTTDNVIVAKNIDEVSALVDEPLAESALGYLSANYELEKAMEYLLNRLEEAGQLDRTVIVLTGDHYPYYLSDYGYSTLTGTEIDEDFGSYKSTCIIYNAGMDKNIYVNEPCCNVDILPTILNLFNINYDSRLYAGTDIFSDGDHIAQLSSMSFVTKYVKYNYATGEATWLINTDNYDQEKLDTYLDNMINTIKNKYKMSMEIEDSDFYQFVFDNYKLTSDSYHNYVITKEEENLESDTDTNEKPLS